MPLPSLNIPLKASGWEPGKAPAMPPGTCARLSSDLSSLTSCHFTHIHLGPSCRELVWSFPELSHTLVPSPVLLPILEGQPSSSSSSSRKPSLVLLVSFGCPSSCSQLHPSSQCHSPKPTILWSLVFLLHRTLGSSGEALCLNSLSMVPRATYECNVCTNMYDD